MSVTEQPINIQAELRWPSPEGAPAAANQILVSLTPGPTGMAPGLVEINLGWASVPRFVGTTQEQNQQAKRASEEGGGHVLLNIAPVARAVLTADRAEDLVKAINQMLDQLRGGGAGS